jgi:hypothetical protein
MWKRRRPQFIHCDGDNQCPVMRIAFLWCATVTCQPASPHATHTCLSQNHSSKFEKLGRRWAITLFVLIIIISHSVQARNGWVRTIDAHAVMPLVQRMIADRRFGGAIGPLRRAKPHRAGLLSGDVEQMQSLRRTIAMHYVGAPSRAAIRKPTSTRRCPTAMH